MSEPRNPLWLALAAAAVPLAPLLGIALALAVRLLP